MAVRNKEIKPMTLKFSKIDLLTLKKFEFQKKNKKIFFHYSLKSVLLKFEPSITFCSRVMAGRNKKESKQASKLANIRTPPGFSLNT